MKDLKKLVDETNDERLLKLKAALKKAHTKINGLKEHKADLARELKPALVLLTSHLSLHLSFQCPVVSQRQQC